MHFNPVRAAPLSNEDWRILKDGVKRFEDAWRRGVRPAIADYLPADGQMRHRLLIELVHIDLELRLRAAEPARIEDYLSAYPHLAEDRPVLRDLIAAEFELRLNDEPGLSLEEYARRFPPPRPEQADAVGLLADSTVRNPKGMQADDAGRKETLPVVAGYAVESRLGRGGMGVVYRARQLSLGRSVALKFLPEAWARDPIWLERFRREAQTASALNHPNICTIYDTGDNEGRPYLCMELIDGETFEALIRTRRPLVEASDLFRQAANALAAAHAAGVVHRDIKPHNLMVRADGIVKVLDFGLARRLPEGDTAEKPSPADTGAGMLVGTVRYMSPEQTRAEPVGNPTDIFSLGMVFYEATTGQHPFSAESESAMLRAIAENFVVPAVRLNPEITVAIDGLIQRMLAKDPSLRPTAAEVGAFLTGRRDDSERLVKAPAPPRKRPTVGRTKERRALRADFESASAGCGRMICVTGEPGLGKTTLVDDFLEELSASGHAWVLARGHCSERLAGAEAYLPFLEALDSLLHGLHGDGVAQIMKRLAPTWYVQLAPTAADDPAFRIAEVKDASQERRKREIAVFLKELSLSCPVVLFLDDVHWADPSSVDLLAYLGNQCTRLRLLLVLTYRPSDLLRNGHPFGPIKLDLEARGSCVEISLPFLERADLDQYLELVYPGHRFPDDFAAVIHAKTEGNPLFMVDLLRYLQDCGTLAPDSTEADRWSLALRLPDLQRDLPASVRGMIQRKVNLLGEADRLLLAAASVQGTEFDSAVAAAVLEMDAVEVEERLNVLERVHALVRLMREHEFPDRTLTLRYRFVHVLYQNAFFASLSPTRRTKWSGAAAGVLLRHYGEKCSAVATELALLFETARDPASSVDCFLLASRNAVRLFAHQEAAALAGRGLALLADAAHSPACARHELPLLLTLGVSLVATKGFASPDVEQTYLRARRVCREGDDAELFPILYGLWNLYLLRCELSRCDEFADQMLRLAEAKANSTLLMMACNALQEPAFHRGDLVVARRRQEQGLALYEQLEPHALTADFGEDPGVSFLMYGALTLWLLGFPDQALASSRSACELAEKLGNPFNRARSLYFGALTHVCRREPREADTLARSLMDVCDENGFALLHAGGSVVHGWCLTHGSDIELGIETMRQGIADWHATGAVSHRPFQLGLLAEALARAGRPLEGMTALEEALAVSSATSERFWEAELHRLAGELRLALDPADRAGAEECFRTAQDVARRQAAKSLELRSAVSWTRHCLESDNRFAACARLREAFDDFREGYRTRDLVEAQSLVDTLNPGP